MITREEFDNAIGVIKAYTNEKPSERGLFLSFHEDDDSYCGVLYGSSDKILSAIASYAMDKEQLFLLLQDCVSLVNDLIELDEKPNNTNIKYN